MDTGPEVAVVLASAGRPELLARLVADLQAQTHPFTLVLSVPDDGSLPPTGIPAGARVARASGLPAQRNAGLALVPEAEFVFFFDDDAVVRADYLANGVDFFRRHPDAVAMTGRVLLDGAARAEIPRSVAVDAIERSAADPAAGTWAATRELYGCNFAFRPGSVGGERFDDRLPLYAWLEDHDFARRVARFGFLAAVDDCVIVHLGVKSGGRTAHRRLGYAQVMNPAYLWHKGSFPFPLAMRETVFRVGKNAVRAVAGPERQWRRRRLAGNVLAVGDVLRARFTPERLTDIPPDPPT